MFNGQYSNAQSDSVYFTNPTAIELIQGVQFEVAAPILSTDGQTLYFTVTDKDELSKTGELFHEIWSSQLSNGEFGAPKKQPAPFNNGLNSAVIGTSKNGNRVYLFNTYDPSFPDLRGISVIEKTYGQWTKPKPLSIPGLRVKGGFYGFYVHPSEKIILVSIPMQEQEDLYITLFSEETNTWTQVQKLPEQINTMAFETAPFLNYDTNTLYFSREEKDGSVNIYSSSKLDGSYMEWSQPEILPSPINNDSFDAYFSVHQDGTVLFSSNRNGQSAIYHSRLKRIKGKKQNSAIEATPILSQEVSTPEPLEYTIEQVNTNTLFYPFDKFALTETQRQKLSIIAYNLLDNPSLKIEISGHADYIASEEYNYGLSDRRAIQVAQYFLNNGIDKSRIFVMAYGETLPISNNDTPKGRRLNRRVEVDVFYGFK